MRTDALPLFQRSIRESIRALVGWCAGLTAACLLYLPLYPSMGGAQMQQMIDSLPPEMTSAMGFQSIATGAGYVQSTVLGLIGFVLLSIAVIGWGTASIAGDEERGGLELALAHAVTRTQVVLEAVLSLIVRLTLLCAVLLLLILVLNEPSQLGIAPGAAVAGVSALAGLALLTGLAALTAGALIRSKTAALLAGTAVAVLGYILNALANQSTDLDWLHGLSPYHWAYGEEPMSNGFDPGGLALLYGFSALLVIVAVVGLRRRDVGN